MVGNAIRSFLGALSCLATLLMVSSPAAAQAAYAWADQPTSKNYEPKVLYASNPFGSVKIGRRGTGRYTVVFKKFGANANDNPGSGGHVQVSAYGTADRCSIERWNFRQPDFTASVTCFKGGTANTPVDARFTVMATFGRSMTTLPMMIGTPEIDALQAGISDLQAQAADLVQRIRVLESR